MFLGVSLLWSAQRAAKTTLMRAAPTTRPVLMSMEATPPLAGAVELAPAVEEGTMLIPVDEASTVAALDGGFLVEDLEAAPDSVAADSVTPEFAGGVPAELPEVPEGVPLKGVPLPWTGGADTATVTSLETTVV